MALGMNQQTYGLNGAGGGVGSTIAPGGWAPIVLTNGDATGMVLGSLAYISANDTVSKAKSNGTLAQASCLYMSLDTIVSGGTGRFVGGGIIGGLAGGTFNTLGYLGTTAGVMAAAPDLTVGEYNVLLGLWLSATEFQFHPQFPFLN